MTRASSAASPTTPPASRPARRRGVRALVVVAVAAATALVAGCSGEPTPAPTPTADPWAAWDAALAETDTASARWLALGDSLTEGQGASSVENRWIDLTRDALQQRYAVDGVTGGVGYRPGVYAVYGPDSTWAAWQTDQTAVTPDYTTPSLGYRSVDLEPGSSVTYQVTGSDLDLWWSPGGGPFRYLVDGVEGAPVDTSAAGASDAEGGAGPVAGAGVTTVSGLESAVHTVTVFVDPDAPAGFVFEGITAFDGDRDRGVTLFDSAHTGATVADFTADLDGFLSKVAAAQPDLVTITLGANDAADIGPAELETGYRGLVDGIKALDDPPTVVLVDEFSSDLGGLFARQGSSADYQAAVASVAEQTGSVLLPLGDALLADAAADGELSSLLSADGVHPNDDGARVVADRMIELLGR